MSLRPRIDGIPLPDPAAIERQRRKEQPAHDGNHIQPTVEDIDRGNYERWIEEQRRRQPEHSDRGVTIIDIGGGDDDE